MGRNIHGGGNRPPRRTWHFLRGQRQRLQDDKAVGQEDEALASRVTELSRQSAAGKAARSALS